MSGAGESCHVLRKFSRIEIYQASLLLQHNSPHAATADRVLKNPGTMPCSCVQASDHLGEIFESKGAERAEAEAPHLSQMFHVGQMVRCTVIEVGRGSERIGMPAAQQMQASHPDWPCEAPLHAGLQLSRGLCR